MSKWTFQQFRPPKARGSVKNVDENWVVEEKYDGDRRIAQFCFDAVRFTGTRDSVKGGGFVEKTANLPHLNEPVPYLEGTVLDGEIIYDVPGARSKDVAAIMGSAPEVAVAKQNERGWLTYAVFDCLFYRGTDVRDRPLEGRRVLLRKAVIEWQRSVEACGYVFVVQQTSAKHAETLFKDIVQQGGEGLIYKDLRARYGDERAWVKRKREATYDVVIMGFTAGGGKYLGQVGAIEFGQVKDGELTYCGQCSGMDDYLRAELSKYPKRYLQMVMEIKANAREPSGKFRHPQFVRLRPDKTAKDCVFNSEEQ